MSINIFLFGRAKIVSVLGGDTTLHVLNDTVYELTPVQIDKLAISQFYTANELHDYSKQLFLEKVKADFIQTLRTDLQLKRAIGGKKWTVALLDDKDIVSVHLTRDNILNYHKRRTEIILNDKSVDMCLSNHDRVYSESVLDALQVRYNELKKTMAMKS